MQLRIINKIIILTIIIFAISAKCKGQIEIGKPVIKFQKANDALVYKQLYQKFSNNKILPDGYETQALIALSYYPELKDKFIEFRFKKAKIAHSAKPKFLSLFQKLENRKYVITISDKIKEKLESTRLKNLSYNAQIGVLGHELAHIVDYSKLKFCKMISFGFKYLQKKKKINIEQKTDHFTIDKGLAYQLLAWKKEAYKAIAEDGRAELYLSPDEVDRIIQDSLD